MTNDQIIQLAKNAAHSAMDAHAANQLPSAETAYDFQRQMAWEEFAGNETEAQKLYDSMHLSPQDWVLFRAWYRATVNERIPA